MTAATPCRQRRRAASDCGFESRRARRERWSPPALVAPRRKRADGASQAEIPTSQGPSSGGRNGPLQVDPGGQVITSEGPALIANVPMLALRCIRPGAKLRVSSAFNEYEEGSALGPVGRKISLA